MPGKFRKEFQLVAVMGAVVLLVCGNLLAQSAEEKTKSLNPSETLRGHQGAALRITVVNPNRQPLDRQALIRLHSGLLDTINWQTTAENSQTYFEDLPLGKYDIEVSAVGYLTNRTTLDVATVANPVELTLVLQHDTAFDPEENDVSLPPKTLHDIKRAVRALNVGDFREAQKRLEEADKVSPACARVKFLLGYLYFAKGDFDQAQAALVEATSINPRYGRASTLLGRLQLVREQYPQAVITLERATEIQPDNWVAHDLLADVYLQQHEYEKARKQAELAIDTAGGEGSIPELALGEALANLGQNSEAIVALKVFLNTNAKTIAAPHAQELLRKLEHYKSRPNESWSESERQVAQFDIANDLVISPRADLPPVSWLPANIDRGKPPVVAGLTCPAEQVIKGAGERVEDLVTNVEKFAAIESVTYERLDEAGNPSASATLQFDYSASVSTKTNVVLVDEYRAQRYDRDTLPDRIADNGFMALAFVFHPEMRDAFKMTCEGLGEWHGKATWLVRFQQRDDRPNHMQAYLLGSIAYPVNLKGRAWISAGNYQVVRIESDMVTPMPQIELLAEHIVADYSSVPFPKKGLDFWLPQNAEVYMYFRGQRYYRRHAFDKYMLFSVDTEEKVHEASQSPDNPKSKNPAKPKVLAGLNP